MQEVNVMIEDKEKVVKEKNSNQEQKQILNEYLMKYDIRAGQVIYWYFHSKHPRSKAIEERNFIAVAVALITKILSSIAYIAATYLIIYKYIEFIFITSNSENKNKVEVISQERSGRALCPVKFWASLVHSYSSPCIPLGTW